MATVLTPLPSRDFDPTETGVPWRVLTAAGHRVLFATPDGEPGVADPRMVTGQGLGLLAPLLRADRHGRAAHEAMTASPEFRRPLRYEAAVGGSFDALLLPGGHARGMRPYLESTVLQGVVGRCFAADLPVGAICHGVLLAARSAGVSGASALHGRRTTALLRRQELLAWRLTRAYLGDYYRTYPATVEDEVTAVLAQREDFDRGPISLARDTPDRPNGFVVVDGRYVSSRWPGDAHAFARAFEGVLAAL
jgi:protease I